MDACGGDGGEMVEEGGVTREGAAEGISEAIVAGGRWKVESREKGIAVEERGGETISTATIGGC